MSGISSTVRFQVRETGIFGCLKIRAWQHEDERGTLELGFDSKQFAHMGLPTEWAQDNFSRSRQHVIRGLHLQTKEPQGKLVSCHLGSIMDYCVDVRPDSPTFGKFEEMMLCASLPNYFYLPPGTAHGFIALGYHGNVVHYKCTTLYDRASDTGINPMDEKIGIPWANSYMPRYDKLKISDKDRHLPSLDEYLARIR